VDEIKDEIMMFVRKLYYKGGRRKIHNKDVICAVEDISRGNNKAFHTKTECAKIKIIERFMPRVREYLLQPQTQNNNNSLAKKQPCKSSGEGEECLDLCRRKDNCQYKRMVNKTLMIIGIISIIIIFIRQYDVQG
jgi:hypothetical protein